MRAAWTAVRRSRAIMGSATARQAFRELTAPVAGWLRVATGLAVLAAVAGLVPLVGIWLIARTALDGGGSGTTGAVVLVAVGAVAAGLFRIAAYGVGHAADVRLARSIRHGVADHLARVPLGWFVSGAGERVLASLQHDVDELHAAVAHGRVDRVLATLTPVLALGWLLVVDWRLALVITVPSVVSLVLWTRSLSGDPQRMRAVPLAIGALTDAAARLVRNMPTLRVTGRRADTDLLAAADHLRDALTSAVALRERRGARANALVAPVVTLALVLAAGAAMIAGGLLPVADLLPFLLAGILVAGITRFPETGASMRIACDAAERLQGVLALPVLPRPEEGRIPDGSRVELSGVEFGHDPERRVLHGIDLVLEPGTVTALVGPSGAGKSTLAGLVARFHDPDAGSVRLGGVDLREIEEGELYRRVGFVLQDAVMLRTSLRDNIRLAVPDADDEAVTAAAAAAGIHEKIAALPQGYDTVAGQDVQLSGGERQRIAIARVLLADPPVLVLDEPTAHVDPEAEADIQDALARLASGRVVLVVAHRLTTVTGVDRIVVLDGGRVVQSGRHEELVGVPGTYRELWEAHTGAGVAA